MKCICPCWPSCTTYAAYAAYTMPLPASCYALCETPLADHSYMHVQTFLGRGQTSVRRAVILSLHIRCPHACCSCRRSRPASQGTAISDPSHFPIAGMCPKGSQQQSKLTTNRLSEPTSSSIVDETSCVVPPQQKLLSAP